MRRTFSFYMPTLLLSLITQLVWVSIYSPPISQQALAAAPITPSGLNTQVSQPVTLPSGQTQYNITGGTRPGGGTNLFHSFGDFNVPNHNIANFLNDSGLATSNILGRVTGGNMSNIFGTIQTTGFGNANLFLMNPAGFLFGPNATVNVGGMVSFTSADYLKLTDGAHFNAIPNAAADALLSASPVTAFGFLGSNPGAITVQGSQLTVTPGQSLSLVGGNITIQSGTLSDGTTVRPAVLTAQGGQINLASVASPGEILVGTMNQAPNINGQSFGALGTIQVVEQSNIDASGNGGGTVLIRGGQFVLDNSTISANVMGPGPIINGVESIGSGIDIQVNQNAVIQNAAVLETNVSGNATPGVQYGGVHVKADSIQIIGSQDFDNFPFTGIRSDISPGSTGGNGGNILLEGNTILVQDLGTFSTTLETTTGGAGNAANIVLTGNNNITIDGAIVQSMSQSSPGNAGNVSFSSMQGNIVVKNDPLIQSVAASGSGSTGTISFVAQRDISISTGPFNATFILTESDFGSGNVGNIQLKSTEGNISLTGGPVISSQTLSSTGTAGNITVNAPNGDVLLEGGAFSGSLITALRPPLGQSPNASGSGAIEVTARNLTVHNSAITADNLSSLEPGNITINLSGTLNLTGTFTDANGAVIHSLIQTTSRGTAQSADLNITAHDVHISDGAVVSTEAFRSGNAGNLTILTQNLELTNGGQARSGNTSSVLNPGQPATDPSGAGGTITIQGPNGPATSVLIDGAGSSISTSTVGTGAAGNILVNASSVTLHNGALVTSSSTGPGTAGNININAGNQFVMANSSVTTQANQASGGTIKITTTPSGTVELSNSTISASVLDGTGGGGSVNIDPQFVLLQNSQILANAVQGPGGNISITTNVFLPDANSVVSASSQFGVNGTVAIQSPINPAGGRIIPLSQKPITATALLSQRCAALTGGEFSSFTVAGRDSLPAEPGGWLASPLALTTLSGGTGLEARGEGKGLDERETRDWRERREAKDEGEIGRLVGETQLLSLRQISPPGFLTQAFAVDWSAGCTS